jgi:hypothetical protein
MTDAARIFTTDAILKRVTSQLYRIACGRHGCPEMPGYAVRGDYFAEDVDHYEMEGDEWEIRAAQESFERSVREAREVWYLVHRTKAYRRDDHGDYHIVELRRGRPRRQMPTILANEIGTSRIGDALVELVDPRGVVGQRPVLPVYLYCPACKKRYADTRNWIRVL